MRFSKGLVQSEFCFFCLCLKERALSILPFSSTDLCFYFYLDSHPNRAPGKHNQQALYLHGQSRLRGKQTLQKQSFCWNLPRSTCYSSKFPWTSKKPKSDSRYMQTPLNKMQPVGKSLPRNEPQLIFSIVLEQNKLQSENIFCFWSKPLQNYIFSLRWLMISVDKLWTGIPFQAHGNKDGSFLFGPTWMARAVYSFPMETLLLLLQRRFGRRAVI